MMGTFQLRAAPEVLRALPSSTTATVAVAPATATENDDGTWSLVVHGGEDRIPALEALGCQVEVLVTDAQELERWQVIDDQIDREPPAVA
jgi:hypothetical protein